MEVQLRAKGLREAIEAFTRELLDSPLSVVSYSPILRNDQNSPDCHRFFTVHVRGRVDLKPKSREVGNK